MGAQTYLLIKILRQIATIIRLDVKGRQLHISSETFNIQSTLHNYVQRGIHLKYRVGGRNNWIHRLLFS